MPLRGKGLADLPATVRAVTESSCLGTDVLGFWTALGFQRQYSMIKQGFCVDCHIDNQDVHVTGTGAFPALCAMRTCLICTMLARRAGQLIAIHHHSSHVNECESSSTTILFNTEMYIWDGYAVVKVCKEGSSGAAGEHVAPGFWLVEASTRAAEGQHVAAAAAIGTLAGLLEPLVVLQKQ